jgi:GntR family transcriptional regulator
MHGKGGLNRSPPLYSQVAEVIAERIANKTWKPGALMPNEIDFAREFGVSMGTVRKALDELQARRIIERRQGRGTFVLDQSANERALRYSRIIDEHGTVVCDPNAMLLSQEIAPATLVERRHLELREGEEVIRTIRLRCHSGRPARHETACLAKRRTGIASLQEVGDYLIVPLAQKCGVYLGPSTESVTIIAAPVAVSELLEIEPGRMLLKLDRVIRSVAGEPIEWRVSLCDLRDEYYLVEMH